MKRYSSLVGRIACSMLVVAPLALGQQQATSATDERLAGYLKRFPAADANADGVLTRPEAKAFHAKRSRQQKGGGKARKGLTPTEADVRYGDHPRNVLDWFRAESDVPTPVLIFFHGGGFVAGDKQKGATQPVSRQCLESGISVVSANYRFVRQGRDGAPAEPFPGPMLDGARVVQFVRSKAVDWNIDPRRIALSGGSAGAVMSMWIALHDEMADPENQDPILRHSTRVSTVVAYSGPTTLDPAVILKHVGGRPDVHPSLIPFYGVETMNDLQQPAKQALVQQASPLNMVSDDDPPLYLKYGGAIGEAPLPADASHGKSIHHPMFGKLMRDAYDELGLVCHVVCRDSPAKMDELAFLKAVFKKPEAVRE